MAAKVERAADDVLSLAGQICRFRGVELEDGAKTCEIYMDLTGFNTISCGWDVGHQQHGFEPMIFSVPLESNLGLCWDSTHHFILNPKALGLWKPVAGAELHEHVWLLPQPAAFARYHLGGGRKADGFEKVGLMGLTRSFCSRGHTKLETIV